MAHNSLNILIVASVILFAVAILLDVAAGMDLSTALIWDILSVMYITYYDLPQNNIQASPFILVASILNVLIFSMLTIWLTALFFGLVKSISLRDRIIKSRIKKMNSHVILMPFNSFANTLMRNMENAHIAHVVISEKEADVDEIYKRGFTAIAGRVGSTEALMNAGIKRAKYVIACSESDIENMYIAMSAKAAIGSVRVISRLANTEDISKLGRIGIYKLVMPESASGTEIANELLKRVV